MASVFLIDVFVLVVLFNFLSCVLPCSFFLMYYVRYFHFFVSWFIFLSASIRHSAAHIFVLSINHSNSTKSAYKSVTQSASPTIGTFNRTLYHDLIGRQDKLFIILLNPHIAYVDILNFCGYEGVCPLPRGYDWYGDAH